MTDPSRTFITSDKVNVPASFQEDCPSWRVREHEECRRACKNSVTTDQLMQEEWFVAIEII